MGVIEIIIGSILLLALFGHHFLVVSPLKKEIQEFKDIAEEYKNKAEKAVNQSRSVIRGQISEQLVPLFKDFPYNSSDLKFSGQPIDYLVFENMSKLRDTGEGEISIIFADVKSNTSKNSKIQVAIKKAIEQGRVKFENWNIDLEGNLKIK